MERDRSDSFWEVLQFPALYDEEYRSLREMYDAVHVVVHGRLSNVYIGQEIVDSEGEPPVAVAFATFEVVEVLKGAPVSRTPGRIEVRLFPPGREWQTIQETLPAEDYLLFLYNEAEWRAETGRPSIDAGLEATTYFRPNDQALLREIDGNVSIIKLYRTACERGLERFPLKLDGRPFDEVVQQVRDLQGP